MNVLGISCFYHDSAAALVSNGEILAAAQEERFTRIKHDPNFPVNAVWACLKRAGMDLSKVDAVAFYDSPDLKLSRIFEQFALHAPRGRMNFRRALDQWLRVKYRVEAAVRERLGYCGPIHFSKHHLSHAASAFYPSPFESAAILTVDGVGEYSTTTWGVGRGNKVTLKGETVYPHSLGLLYSAFTYYTGFRVNSGEYKLMGLASYGAPRYKELILDKMVSLQDDGSFKLDMKYFDFDVGGLMITPAFEALLGGPATPADAPPTQRDMDMAASIQAVVEEVLLKMAHFVHGQTGEKNLVMAGGVALNCVANSRILLEGPFSDIWVQPAAGDAGGALGAAYEVFYRESGMERRADNRRDRQQGSLLGPEYEDGEIQAFLANHRFPAIRLEDADLFPRLAEYLDQGKVVGWFSGPMEFGPRALGCRSILADARREDTQSTLNLKIKYRESFRPFAPIVMLEHAAAYFEPPTDVPYMLFVANVREDKRLPLPDNYNELFGLEKLHIPRSQLPAITHLDFSARLQTVSSEVNPRVHGLLGAFHERTGCPVLVNTSFNVRGEPIVCTPRNAYDCFMSTEMDLLVLGNWLLFKEEQPAYHKVKTYGID